MVYLLLDATPGSAVSLEVLEDVAVEEPAGDVNAIQVKSARKTNPVSNRAVDFWKTFNNWAKAVEKGELELKSTNFEIRLGRQQVGPICESFRGAKTPAQAKAAVVSAKEEFYSKNGSIRKGVTGELLGHIKDVFAPARTKLVEAIVLHFSLSSGTGHAYEDLLARIRAKLIDEDLSEDVLLHGLAWVKKCVDTAVENDLPPVIAVNAFRKELLAFRDRLRGRDYLPSFASSQPSDVQIELQRVRVFVHQLEFVDFAEDQVLRAISDFLISKADRVQYADRGYVHSESFREFEDALVALWMNHRDEIELDQQNSAKVRGKMIALRCLREMLKLQGVEVNATFVRGCFHTLADVKVIGWHPDYMSLLEQMEHQ